jgi:membrane-associated phospholipid phosphatase
MRSARLIKTVIIALILAVGGGALALAEMGGSGASAAAFKGSPVPALFGDAQIAIVDAPLKEAERRGHAAAKAWLDAHPITTDAAFAAWAVAAVGTPPHGSAPRAELAQLRTLAGTRDAAGVTAATWLESHGKNQTWKLFRKQEKPFLPAPRYASAKTALKDALTLGGTLQLAAKTRYARPSPYVTDPSLHALNQARFSGQSRQSYPSKHTVLAGAALAILGPLEPHRVAEFDWMTDEIAYSRMYAGGHYLSDLTAGAFLGTAIGDYERRKAGLTS